MAEETLVLGAAFEFKHVNETGQRAATPTQEVAAENLVRGGSLVHVDGQTLTEEDLELSAELVRMLQRGGAIGGDEV